MIIVEKRERTGQLDISNLECLVNKEHTMPEIVLVIRTELFIPRRCAKSSAWKKPTAAGEQTITGASVPSWESDLGRVHYLGLKTGLGHLDHTSYLLHVAWRCRRQPELQLRPLSQFKCNCWFNLELGRSHHMAGKGGGERKFGCVCVA